MTTWLAIGLLAVLAALWMARGFLQRGNLELAEGDQAISIYRDQIEAVQRDAERGLISEAERNAAEREIEARALRAGRELDNGLLASRASKAAALGVVLVTVAGSGALYWSLGAPGSPDQPLAFRREQLLQQQASAGDAAAQATLVEEELDAAPDSFEKWWTLARARSAAGDHAAAAEAYRRAAATSGDRPSVLSAYGEALTLANGNKVPLAAEIVFGQVLAKRPREPRARYYTALAKAQEQDFEGALADWLALYGDSAPDAPWAATVRRDIINMARFTRTPLDRVLLDATAEEIALAAAPPPERGSDEDRIAGLEAALAAQPKDYERSIELARLYAASGSTGAAARTLDSAKAAYPGAPFVQQRLAEAARELGLAGARGPSDAEIAAAAEMSEDERADMIRGMVSGLAARLQAEPDDLDGWLMLIRSYAVLQDVERAQESARKAYEHFSTSPDQQAAIRATAAEFGISLM